MDRRRRNAVIVPSHQAACSLKEVPFYTPKLMRDGEQGFMAS